MSLLLLNTFELTFSLFYITEGLHVFSTRPSHQAESPARVTRPIPQAESAGLVSRSSHQEKSPGCHQAELLGRFTRPLPGRVARSCYHTEISDGVTRSSHQVESSDRVTRSSHQAESPGRVTRPSRQSVTIFGSPCIATVEIYENISVLF